MVKRDFIEPLFFRLFSIRGEIKELKKQDCFPADDCYEELHNLKIKLLEDHDDGLSMTIQAYLIHHGK